MVKRKKMGMSLILGSTMMVAGPVLAGCSTGVSADDWAATEGAIGRINMDAVQEALDRKSTRLNSSHKPISYAVFCLKKKKKKNKEQKTKASTPIIEKK